MNNTNNNTFLGLLAGTAIGAVIGVLYAPDKGSVTRQKIADKAQDTKDALIESSRELKEKAVATMAPKRASLNEEIESLVTDASYKAEDVISSLEKTLADLKKKNKNLQKS
ncbi:YtxH domain-containing protein [uncultured Winogradskyella sp.]|mgnify:CR=1 FL=1|jgi:gas vesicle protein|uniref:YtxH domain-containing protein n=1 Tax=uncultured Winogradskyella sp. TaxID=395353 RepID=UPI003515B12D